MLYNGIDALKEIDDFILDPELREIKELLKRLCGRKKRNLTTGPVIKPVRFVEDNRVGKKQVPDNFVIVKALNNTSQPQSATIAVYNLGVFAFKNEEGKNLSVEVGKTLIFSQTIEIQPLATVYLPVNITSVAEYEVQVLEAPAGLYFSAEFIPPTPIPTAQAGTTSPNENIPGAVIDSHIVTYSHQFVPLEL